MHSQWLAALSLLLVLSPARSQDVKIRGKAFDIAGSVFTSALSINNSGVIVGWYEDQSQVTHGFIFDHGALTNVDAPGGTSTICLGINSIGEVVGQYIRASGKNIGFLYRNGQFKDIDPFPGDLTGASGINDAGDIVGGYALCQFCRQHGYRFDGRTYTTVDTPGVSSSATAINNVGVMTMIGVDAKDRYHGYLYNGTTFTNIDIPGVAGTLPHGINNLGDVALEWFGKQSVNHGALLRNGKFTKFDAPGATDGGVSGINDDRRMVGTYFIGNSLASAEYRY
jgi:uncharacterized membrane protein